MTKFKMRNRPKKPAEPRHVDMEVGNYVTLSYLMESVEKFKVENPEVDSKDITVESMYDDCGGISIYLTAPLQSREIYDKKIQEYKIELEVYESWRVKYKKEIEKHKAATKKLIAKRKLERLKERLNKELAAAEAKLEKA